MSTKRNRSIETSPTTSLLTGLALLSALSTPERAGPGGGASAAASVARSARDWRISNRRPAARMERDEERPLESRDSRTRLVLARGLAIGSM